MGFVTYWVPFAVAKGFVNRIASFAPEGRLGVRRLDLPLTRIREAARERRRPRRLLPSIESTAPTPQLL